MITQIKSGRSQAAKKDDDTQIRTTVEAMLEQIETRGEAAVRDYSTKLDHWTGPRSSAHTPPKSACR